MQIPFYFNHNIAIIKCYFSQVTELSGVVFAVNV